MAKHATFESKLDLSRGLSALLIIQLPAVIYGVEISSGRAKFPFEIPGWVLVLVATSALAIAFCVRHGFLGASEKARPWRVGDKHLARWFVGQLISAIYAEFTRSWEWFGGCKAIHFAPQPCFTSPGHAARTLVSSPTSREWSRNARSTATRKRRALMLLR